MNEWIIFHGRIYPDTDDGLESVIHEYCRSLSRKCIHCKINDVCDLENKTLYNEKDHILKMIGAITSG